MGILKKSSDGKFVSSGEVIDIDLPSGTVTIRVRYYDKNDQVVPSYRAEDLTIPIPHAMPDWCKQKGADFKFRCTVYPKKFQFLDPHFMTDFELEDYWWLTVDELEKLIGYNGQKMSEEEYAACMARKPAEYRPLDFKWES